MGDVGGSRTSCFKKKSDKKNEPVKLSAPGLRWPLVGMLLYSGGEMCRNNAGGDRAVNVVHPPVNGTRNTDDIGNVAFNGPAVLCGTPSVCFRTRPPGTAGDGVVDMMMMIF